MDLLLMVRPLHPPIFVPPLRISSTSSKCPRARTTSQLTSPVRSRFRRLINTSAGMRPGAPVFLKVPSLLRRWAMT